MPLKFNNAVSHWSPLHCKPKVSVSVGIQYGRKGRESNMPQHNSEQGKVMMEYQVNMWSGN